MFASKHHKQILLWIDKAVVEFNDSATLVQVAMRFALRFKFSQWRRNFAKMGACCCSESMRVPSNSLQQQAPIFAEKCYEAAGNLRNHSRWCSGCQITERNNLSIKIGLTSGFHCADIGRKLVFPCKLLFCVPDHQEIPTAHVMSCWVRRWIQEDFSSDESSDEGTPRVNQLPGVTLRGRCTMLH